jgi:hypothetical protein
MLRRLMALRDLKDVDEKIVKIQGTTRDEAVRSAMGGRWLRKSKRRVSSDPV